VLRTALLEEIKSLNRAVKAADEKARASSLAYLEEVVGESIADEGVRLVYDRVKTSIKDNNLDVEKDIALLGKVIQGYKELEAQRAGMPNGKTHTGISAATAWNPVLQGLLGTLEESLKQGESVSFDSYNKKKEELQALLVQVDSQEAIVKDLFKVTIEERPGESVLHTAYNQACEEEVQICDRLEKPTFSQDPSADLERIKGDVKALTEKQAQITVLAQQLKNRERFQEALEVARPVLEEAHARLSNLSECADVCNVPCADFLKPFQEDFTHASELLNTALFETGSFEADIEKLKKHVEELPSIIQNSEQAVEDKIKKALAPSDDWKEFGEFAATLRPDQMSINSRMVFSSLLDSKLEVENQEEAFTLNPERVRSLKVEGETYHDRLVFLRTDPEVAFAFVKDNLRKVNEQIASLSTQIAALEAKKKAPVVAAASDQGFWGQGSATTATDPLQPQIDAFKKERAELEEIRDEFKCFSELVDAEQAGRSQSEQMQHDLTEYENSPVLNPKGITRSAVLALKTERKREVQELQKQIVDFATVSDEMLLMLKSSEGQIDKLLAVFSSPCFKKFISQFREFSRLQEGLKDSLRLKEAADPRKPAEKIEPDFMASARAFPMETGRRYVQFLKDRIREAFQSSVTAKDLNTLLETYALVKQELGQAEPVRPEAGESSAPATAAAAVESTEGDQFRREVEAAIVQKRTAEIKADPERALQEARAILEEGKKELAIISAARKVFEPDSTVEPDIEELTLALAGLEAKLQNKEEAGSLQELTEGILGYPQKMKEVIERVREATRETVVRATADTPELAQLYDISCKVPDQSLREKALAAKAALKEAVEIFCLDVGVDNAENCKQIQEKYQLQLQEIRATPDGCFLFYQSNRMKVGEEIVSLEQQIGEKEKAAESAPPEQQEALKREIQSLTTNKDRLLGLKKMSMVLEEVVKVQGNFNRDYFHLLEVAAPIKEIIDEGTDAGKVRGDVYARATAMFAEIEAEIEEMKAIGEPLLAEMKGSEGDPAKLRSLFSSPRFTQWIDLLDKSSHQYLPRLDLFNQLRKEMKGKLEKEAKKSDQDPRVIQLSKELKQRVAQAEKEGKTEDEIQSIRVEVSDRIGLLGTTPIANAFLDLGNRLNNPNQIMMRYKLLMAEMLKEAKKGGKSFEDLAALSGAVESIGIAVEAANGRRRNAEEREAIAIEAMVQDPVTAYRKAQEAFSASTAQLQDFDVVARIFVPDHESLEQSLRSSFEECATIPTDPTELKAWAKKLYASPKTVSEAIESDKKMFMRMFNGNFSNASSLNQVYDFVKGLPTSQNPEQLRTLSEAREEVMTTVASFREKVCLQTAEAYMKARQTYATALESITQGSPQNVRVYVLFLLNKEREYKTIIAALASLESEKTALQRQKVSLGEVSPPPPDLESKNRELETKLDDLTIRKSALEGRKAKLGVFEELVKGEIDYNKSLEKSVQILDSVLSEVPESKRKSKEYLRVVGLRRQVAGFLEPNQKMMNFLMSLDGHTERFKEYFEGEEFERYMELFAIYAREKPANMMALEQLIIGKPVLKLTPEEKAGEKKVKFELNQSLQSPLALIIQRGTQYELLLGVLYKASQKIPVPEEELMTLSDAIVLAQEKASLALIEKPTVVSSFTVLEKIHTKELVEMLERIEKALDKQPPIVDPERAFLIELKKDLEGLKSSSVSLSDAITAARTPADRAAVFNSEVFRSYSQRVLVFAEKFQSRSDILGRNPLKDALKPDKTISDPKSNQLYLFTYLLETPLKRIARYNSLLSSESGADVRKTRALETSFEAAKASVEGLISEVSDAAWPPAQ
jgi:biopolymer transport protein ExbB/TolQ